MRRSVQQAIAAVRANREANIRNRMSPSPSWSYAETLADEVTRLHKRIEVLEGRKYSRLVECAKLAALPTASAADRQHLEDAINDYVNNESRQREGDGT
jgi:hypothetical protein